MNGESKETGIDERREAMTRASSLSETELSNNLNFYAKSLDEKSVKTFFTEYHARILFILGEEQAFRHPRGNPKVVGRQEIEDFAIDMGRRGVQAISVDFRQRMRDEIRDARERGEGADRLHCLDKRRMRRIFVLGFHSGYNLRKTEDSYSE